MTDIEGVAAALERYYRAQLDRRRQTPRWQALAQEARDALDRCRANGQMDPNTTPWTRVRREDGSVYTTGQSTWEHLDRPRLQAEMVRLLENHIRDARTDAEEEDAEAEPTRVWQTYRHLADEIEKIVPWGDIDGLFAPYRRRAIQAVVEQEIDTIYRGWQDGAYKARFESPEPRRNKHG